MTCDQSDRPASSSTTTHDRRSRASWIAAAGPAGPPPITAQSNAPLARFAPTAGSVRERLGATLRELGGFPRVVVRWQPAVRIAIVVEVHRGLRHPKRVE